MAGSQIIEVPGQGQVEFPEGMSDADIVAAIKKISGDKSVSPMPSSKEREPDLRAERNRLKGFLLGTEESRSRLRDIGTSAVAQGAAGALDTILNAPSNIWNLSKAASGTVAGLAGRPDLMPSVSPAPNYAQRGMQAIGLINPQAEPRNAAESLFAAAGKGVGSMMVAPSVSVQSLAMGAGSGAVGNLVEQATGSKEAGQVAGMLTPLAAVGAKSYADMQAQRLAERKAANSVRDESLRAGREEGMSVAPGDIASTGVKGWVNRRLESFGGKDALRQEINVRNQEMTNAVAQRVLGLPKGTAITEDVLKEYRKVMAAPYEEIAKLPTLPPDRIKGIGGYPLFGPTPKSAADALEELRKARVEANLEWKDFFANKKVDSYNKAVALDKRIDGLEAHIEKTAIAAGRGDLIPALQEARTKIAQSWDIDRALNVGNADISARILARALDKGTPLSGELKSVARFSNAFPGYTAEGANVNMPGVSRNDLYASLGMGLGGYALGGPAGTLAATIPYLRGPMRSMLLSGPYQRMMGSPDYDPGLTTRIASRLPPITEQQAAQQGFLLGRGLSQ